MIYKTNLCKIPKSKKYYYKEKNNFELGFITDLATEFINGFIKLLMNYNIKEGTKYDTKN